MNWEHLTTDIHKAFSGHAMLSLEQFKIFVPKFTMLMEELADNFLDGEKCFFMFISSQAGRIFFLVILNSDDPTFWLAWEGGTEERSEIIVERFWNFIENIKKTEILKVPDDFSRLDALVKAKSYGRRVATLRDVLIVSEQQASRVRNPAAMPLREWHERDGILHAFTTSLTTADLLFFHLDTVVVVDGNNIPNDLLYKMLLNPKKGVDCDPVFFKEACSGAFGPVVKCNLTEYAKQRHEVLNSEVVLQDMLLTKIVADPTLFSFNERLREESFRMMLRRQVQCHRRNGPAVECHHFNWFGQDFWTDTVRLAMLGIDPLCNMNSAGYMRQVYLLDDAYRSGATRFLLVE